MEEHTKQYNSCTNYICSIIVCFVILILQMCCKFAYVMYSKIHLQGQISSVYTIYAYVLSRPDTQVPHTYLPYLHLPIGNRYIIYFMKKYLVYLYLYAQQLILKSLYDVLLQWQESLLLMITLQKMPKTQQQINRFAENDISRTYTVAVLQIAMSVALSPESDKYTSFLLPIQYLLKIQYNIYPLKSDFDKEPFTKHYTD